MTCELSAVGLKVSIGSRTKSASQSAAMRRQDTAQGAGRPFRLVHAFGSMGAHGSARHGRLWAANGEQNRALSRTRLFWGNPMKWSYFILPVTTPDHDDELSLDAAPWARVERVNLIRREVRESLSPNALEILFSRAELVVESGDDPSGE